MRLSHNGARSAQRDLLGPTRAMQLAATIRGGALDQALARGADPAASPLLAARASALGSRRVRDGIADGLERLESAARGPRRRWWALEARDAVLANGGELLELARVLRSREPVYARGTAMLHGLLTDGTGPAYSGCVVRLADALGQARMALRGEPAGAGAPGRALHGH